MHGDRFVFLYGRKYLPFVYFGYLFGDGKSQTAAARIAAARIFRAVETFEYFRFGIRLDGIRLVIHRESRLFSVLFQRAADFSVFRIFQRVVQKNGNDFFDGGRVARDGNVAVEVGNDLPPALEGERVELQHAFSYEHA